MRSGDWRFYGSFERSFSLPENVNADASKEITP
ncbi:MAG: Hsp20/alpha crystallin family protein [Steroidobacteraceae bacterium]